MSFQSDEIICLDSPERAPKRARDSRYSSPEDDLPDIQAIFKADTRSKSNYVYAAQVKAPPHQLTKKASASVPVVAKQIPGAAAYKLPQEPIIEIIESDEDLPQNHVVPKAPPEVLSLQKTTVNRAYNAATDGSKAQKLDKMAIATSVATAARSIASSLPVPLPTVEVFKPLPAKQVSDCPARRPSFDQPRIPNPPAGPSRKPSSPPVVFSTGPSADTLRAKSVAHPPANASKPNAAFSASSAMARLASNLHPSRPAKKAKSLSPEPVLDPMAMPTVATLDDLFDTAAMELDLSSDEEEAMPVIDPKDPLSGRTQGYLHPMAGKLPSSYMRRTNTTIASLLNREKPAAPSLKSPHISISSDDPRVSSPAVSSPVPGLSTLRRTDLTVPVRPRQEPARNVVQLASSSKPVAEQPIAKPPANHSWSSTLPSVPHETRVSARAAKSMAVPATASTGARPGYNLQSLYTQISDDSMTDEDAPEAFTSCAPPRNSKNLKLAATEDAAFARADKARQKAAEKAVKQAEKEAKAAERLRVQSISSVNVLKTNKKDTSPEMIVRVCQSFEKEVFWTHMQALSDASGFECRLESMPVPGLVRFSRKTKAVFNTALGYWEPLPAMVIKEEPQLMIRVLADAFLGLTEQPGALAKHVASVRQVMPGGRVIYLLEGVHAMLNKSRTARNRAFAFKVRQDLDPAGDYTATTGKKKQTVAIEIDDDGLEDALLDLQVMHRCLIVHAAKPVDTARELCTLAQDMSLIPYKSEATKKAGFCIEPGQVKTGRDNADTYEKMLASLHRITPPMAEAIANRYPTIKKLHAALMSNPLALDGTTIGNNVDGSFSQRKIGSITSKNIARVVTSTNPHADASS
ncbi:hypothetical protein BCR37DRAFT_379671 [Protomyces lactucae-debilis]|uniref:ERCC4 domain-containing protein n=1 Tax=Protomyces lactucae-debilis TaxID=2754530 RepID=A0A1Y2FFE6_PROLT|nr:uncharacterized protein BCR37DRAFT_379671 [Protomyces lactucae-debilis]ORY82653.1 hypothetical protein BCR37DRAFT_379671 [Protomyces lactucae-debilis]